MEYQEYCNQREQQLGRHGGDVATEQPRSSFPPWTLRHAFLLLLIQLLCLAPSVVMPSPIFNRQPPPGETLTTNYSFGQKLVSSYLDGDNFHSLPLHTSDDNQQKAAADTSLTMLDDLKLKHPKQLRHKYSVTMVNGTVAYNVTFMNVHDDDEWLLSEKGYDEEVELAGDEKTSWLSDYDYFADSDYLLHEDESGLPLMMADEAFNRRKYPRHTVARFYLHNKVNYLLALWPNGSVGGILPADKTQLEHSLINIVILGQQQLNLQRKFSEPAGYMGLQEVTSRRYLCMNSQGQFYNKEFPGDPHPDCRFHEEQNEKHYLLYYSATHGNNRTSERCIRRHLSSMTSSDNVKKISKQIRHRKARACDKWYLAINKVGKVMKGSRTNRFSELAQFIKKPESDEFNYRSGAAPGMKNIHAPIPTNLRPSPTPTTQQKNVGETKGKKTMVTSSASDGNPFHVSKEKYQQHHKDDGKAIAKKDSDRYIEGPFEVRKRSKLNHGAKKNKNKKDKLSKYDDNKMKQRERLESIVSAYHETRNNKKSRNYKQLANRQYSLPILE